MDSASTETATRGGRRAAKTEIRDAFGNVAPELPRGRGRPAKRQEKVAAREPLRSGQVLSRDGEVLSRRRSTGFNNYFEVPDHLKDPNWDLQWVRTSCHGKPDPANVSAHFENGWRPAAGAALRAHYGATDAAKIESDGQMLCERPMELTKQALAEDRRNALELRNAQAEQFGARDLPAGFEDGRRSGDGRFDASKKVRRSLEGAPSSLLPKRELAVGDDD